MAKGYWVTFYRSVSDPNKVAEYAKLAAPAIAAGGGKFLVRGMPAKTYEAGLNQRTVVIEYDSVQAAIATHDSPGLSGRPAGARQRRRPRDPDHRRGMIQAADVPLRPLRGQAERPRPERRAAGATPPWQPVAPAAGSRNAMPSSARAFSVAM